MNRTSRLRALRRVGLSSAVAVTVLASAAGVAGASTHASRFANRPAVRSSMDAGTNAPPMPPGGPRGIGGDVKAFASSSITVVPATIAGRVSAIDDDSITVTGPRGQSGTIQLSTATIYSTSGGRASLSDVRVGSFVVAAGTYGSLPSAIDAATVGIGMPGPGNGPGPTNGSGNGAGPFPGDRRGFCDESRPRARGVATK